VDDLDAALAATRPAPESARSLVPGRHVHTWTVCACGAHRDMAAPRRGKSARRLGSDQERRIEKLYGPTKVGEFGDAIDLLGRDFKWQSKATRSAPPAWLAAILGMDYRPTPKLVTDAAAAMEPLHRELAPLVIVTHVQPKGTRDWVWVRCRDWKALHGMPHDRPEACVSWWVMSGAHFLTVHGRDERRAAA
jgi:hypothetical protein